ncbi:MAG: hypothetical protein R2744_06355 [Bacteroidales bacterium]
MGNQLARHNGTLKFGDYTCTSLVLITTLLGIPTPKDDIDGSMVASIYYDEGDLNRIARYCEKDVKQIQVFMRFRNDPLVEESSIESVTLFGLTLLFRACITNYQFSFFQHAASARLSIVTISAAGNKRWISSISSSVITRHSCPQEHYREPGNRICQQRATFQRRP